MYYYQQNQTQHLDFTIDNSNELKLLNCLDGLLRLPRNLRYDTYGMWGVEYGLQGLLEWENDIK